MFNEINWALKIKYNIDRNEIFKIIVDRFNDDLKNEEIITLKGIEKQNKKSITHKKILAGELCMKYAKVKTIDNDFLDKLKEYLKYNEEKGHWFSTWFKQDKKN